MFQKYLHYYIAPQNISLFFYDFASSVFIASSEDLINLSLSSSFTFLCNIFEAKSILRSTTSSLISLIALCFSISILDFASTINSSDFALALSKILFAEIFSFLLAISYDNFAFFFGLI